MNDFVRIESPAGTPGLKYRLLWWNYRRQKYVFPQFTVPKGIRVPYTATHPGSLDDVRMARDFLLCTLPHVRVIIVPY